MTALINILLISSAYSQNYHKNFDAYEEERLGGKSFGSTKSGIAPFYSDKYAKIGFQVSELFDDELLFYEFFRLFGIAEGKQNRISQRSDHQVCGFWVPA